MPIFSGDTLGIGVGMDGKDLGMSLRTGRVRVNMQLAETAPERLVAFDVKRLIGSFARRLSAAEALNYFRHAGYA